MSNLKHQSYGGRSLETMNNIKVKDLSSEGGECYGDEDFPGVFSWPPRSYTCSFCKREFRSAQALGGHMNVHRRDRARLRQSPPRDGQPYCLPNLNLDPNPNMNFNMNPSFSTTSSPFSSTATKCPPFISTLPHLFSSTATVPEMRSWVNKDAVSQMNHGIPVTTDFTKIKATKRLFDIENLGSIKHEKEDTPMNKAEVIRLELEIGLLGEEKEDLDLELRLGCTT